MAPYEIAPLCHPLLVPRKHKYQQFKTAKLRQPSQCRHNTFTHNCRCQVPLKHMQLRRHYNLQLLLDCQTASDQPSLYITLYLAKCPSLEAAAMQQVQERRLTLLQTRLTSCPHLSRSGCCCLHTLFVSFVNPAVCQSDVCSGILCIPLPYCVLICLTLRYVRPGLMCILCSYVFSSLAQV